MRGDVAELSCYATRDPERPVRTTIDGYMMGFAKRSFQTIA